MNHARTFPCLSLLLFALLALAGCSQSASEPPLKGATMGGEFSLVGADGPVRSSDFEGRYRIVYFGFASCPDVCPVDLQTIGAGLRAFEAEDPERAAKVQPIFISVDPARDTPAVLAEYVANFHPRLIGLTGSEEEIHQVARDYGVYFQRHEPATPGSDNYLVDHSRVATLYGPAGEPIAIIPHDQGPEGVAAELDRWVE